MRGGEEIIKPATCPRTKKATPTTNVRCALLQAEPTHGNGGKLNKKRKIRKTGKLERHESDRLPGNQPGQGGARAVRGMGHGHGHGR